MMTANPLHNVITIQIIPEIYELFAIPRVKPIIILSINGTI